MLALGSIASKRCFSLSVRRLNAPQSIMNPLETIFKDCMSRIGAQAMILTSAFRGSPSSTNLHGMTLSSVCSLSVSPKPLIQFNLHLPSYTSIQLHELKFFAIHLMPPTTKSVQIARHFAKGVKKANFDTGENNEITLPFNELSPQDWELAFDESNDSGCTINKSKIPNGINIPVLKDAERVLICEKVEVFTIDNHEIWVGEVKEVKCHDEFQSDQKTGGLIFFNRSFHIIGDNLER